MTGSLARLVVLSGLVLTASLTPAVAAAQVPPGMTGGWAGVAKIVEPWSEVPAIEATLYIAPDGRVTGSIGGAVLRDARLERNRGMFGRIFRRGTDWIVIGALDGALVPSEGVRAARVTMPLDWVRDHFEGAFVAIGPGPAGAGNVVLTATQLRLRRLR